MVDLFPIRMKVSEILIWLPPKSTVPIRLPDNKYCRKSKYMNELHGKVLKVTNQPPFLLSKFIFITLVCDYVKS